MTTNADYQTRDQDYQPAEELAREALHFIELSLMLSPDELAALRFLTNIPRNEI